MGSCSLPRPRSRRDLLYSGKVQARGLGLTLNRNFRVALLCAALGALSFGQALSYNRYDLTVGSFTQKVAIADFNHDGKPDIAYLLSGGSAPSVSILLGQGNGTFFGPLTTTFSGAAKIMAVGDLNNDGFPDVISYDYASSTGINILIGNGDGTFQTPRTIPNGAAQGIAIGDFNGDGKADFAATSFLGTVTIYLGNGDGTFNAGIPISTGGSGSNEVVAGDFNHDGKLDLAITNQNSNNVSVLFGQGNGTFAPAVFYPLDPASIPQALALGDINGDGNPDIVIAETSNFAVAVLLGSSNGSFTNIGTIALNRYVYDMVIADVNGDGKLDIVAAIEQGIPSFAAVLLGNGNGTFGTPMDFAVAPNANSAAVGDLNGDGVPDIATVAMSGTTISVLTSGPPVNLTPDFTFSKSHTGNFTQGQTGATFTISAGNAYTQASSGTVTVTDQLPTGLTLVSMSGTGWSCASVTCSRSDPLGPGASYPPITVTVNVRPDALNPLTNTATLAYGALMAMASDTVTINPGGLSAPVLISPSPGAEYVPLNRPLSWSAVAGATSYDVYLGTSQVPPFVANTTSTSYSQTLALNTQYYWEIVARNSTSVGASGVAQFNTQGGYFGPGLPILDFNQDGNEDVFLYDPAAGVGYSGLSNGSGAFTYVYNAFTPGFDTVRHGIFTTNGISGVLVYNSSSTLGYALPGTGTGTFTPVSLFWGPGFTKVAAADLNSAGLGDFVIYRPSDGTSYTAMSNGDGTFSYKYALLSIGFTHMVVADFNDDGFDDVFFYRSSDGLAYLGIGNGVGGFTFSPVTVGPGYGFVEAGDISGDGKADLLLYSSNSGAALVGLSTGSGFTFTPYSYSAGFTIVKLFDFNGDRKADLALYNKNNTLGYLGVSNGTGAFTFSSLFWGAGMDTVDALDLNGDGKIDIVIYNSTNGASYTGISSGNAANPFTYQYAYWGNGKVLATTAAQP